MKTIIRAFGAALLLALFYAWLCRPVSKEPRDRQHADQQQGDRS